MTVGQAGMVHPSLAGMVEAIQAKISRVALHLRFTAQAVKFLVACLKMALEHSMTSAVIRPAALEVFKRVLIFDSSSWDVDPTLKDILPGCRCSARGDGSFFVSSKMADRADF